METVALALVVAFYAAMVLALAYFVHKVLWFVRFRRLQAAMVADAERHVREATAAELKRWDEGAQTTWAGAAPEPDDDDPVAYVRRIGLRLAAMDRALAERAVLTRARPGVETVHDWFVERLGAEDSNGGPESVAVLTMPRVAGGHEDVAIELVLPRLRRPAAPPDELYVLELRSRYGFWRRALAFVLGAADVVYSSSHVARMSQNPEVPVGVIVRRLSLVVLILGAIVVDIALSLRARMIEWVQAWLGPGPHLASAIDPYVPAALALGGWLAIYGAIYFGTYLFLRRRSQVYLRRLNAMRAHREEDLDAIYERHLRKLARWAEGYARTLDDAIAIAARQARLLIRRSLRRMPRRIATDRLDELGEALASRLFAKLPEASSGLEDVATQHEHSLRHALWPRVEEMGYQVELARTRAAWRRMEAGLAALRVNRPDPAAAYALWRTLAAITRMFPNVFDEDDTGELEEAFDAAVRAVVRDTEEDLAELDRRLGELAAGLRDQLAVAGSLLETQIELAEQAMEADVAELAAELLQVREGARLEAMAFEI